MYFWSVCTFFNVMRHLLCTYNVSVFSNSIGKMKKVSIKYNARISVNPNLFVTIDY